jgi:hypothetical protein
VKTIGRNTTRPASKKIGKPNSSAADARAPAGPLLAEAPDEAVGQHLRAAAEVEQPARASRPSPTSSATLASVVPKPSVSVDTTSASGMRVASATRG